MWFKNLHIFRLLQPFNLTAEALHDKLSTAVFRPCHPMEMTSLGWVSPLGPEGKMLVHAVNQCFMVTARKQEKILPASVLREAVQEHVTTIEMTQMRKVRKREKNAIRDEILQDFLPRAFTRSTWLFAYFDVKNQWLIIDTPSRKKAEELTVLLRKCLGSLAIVSLKVQKSPVNVMTQWLAERKCPPGLVLDDACELNEPSEEGAMVNCKRQDLLTDEINLHLKAGKAVTRLALRWDERIAFVFTVPALDRPEWIVKCLQFLEVIQEQTKAEETQSFAEQFDADFALMSLELANFIPQLLQMFGGEDETQYG